MEIQLMQILIWVLVSGCKNKELDFMVLIHQNQEHLIQKKKSTDWLQKCFLVNDGTTTIDTGSTGGGTTTGAGDLTLRTYKDGKGKFGRILGEIWYGGEHNINQLLVDSHHAVRYHGQSKEDIAEEHIANRAKLNLY